MKISERAYDIASKSVPTGYPFEMNAGHVVQALDEWQASVEERLSMVGRGETPRAAVTTRLSPFELESTAPSLASELDSSPVRLVTAMLRGFPIIDPGPHPRDTPHEWDHASQTASRYEPEPFEEELL